MRFGAIWEFIAGDSRRTPVAVGVALGVAALLLRENAPSIAVGAAFTAIVGIGLAAGVFERS